MSVLGVDVGTSGCKGLVIDAEGKVLASASSSYQRATPAPGRCEIHPQELLAAVDAVISRCASEAPEPVQALAFSVFGGSFVALDSNLRPLCNLISTTDDRGAPDAEAWKRDFGCERTYGITGLVPHPSFLLLKALAFRRMDPELWKRTAHLASAVELIHTHLGLPPVTDTASASTYMACDITTGQWSEEILAAAGIEPRLMPEVRQSGAVIGEVGGDVARELGLCDGAVVVAGGHDQQAASFGAGLIAPGEATDSLGTVEAIATAMDAPQLGASLRESNLPNWLHVWGGKVFTLVYSFACADLLNWAMRVFCAAEAGQEMPALKRALDEMPDEPARALVLPHFAGSGTPHMDPFSRGAVTGLDLSMSRADIVRAIVDSQNYEMRLNLDIWRGLEIEPKRLRVYGGLAQSDRLLQIKADVLGVEVVRLEQHEAGCFGAAVLAGYGSGAIADPVGFLRDNVQEKQRFQPRRQFAERHGEQYETYRGLYGAVRNVNHALAGRAE